MEDRLLKLLDTEQLSSSKFADVIGVQRSSVSHILTGRNKPSFDFLQKTLKAFPMLNSDWLILGEGEMYEGEQGPGGGSLFDQPAKSPAVGDDHTDSGGTQQAEAGSDISSRGSDKSGLSGSEANISSGEELQQHRIVQDSRADRQDISDQPAEERPATGSVIAEDLLSHSAAEVQQSTKEKKLLRVVLFYDDNSFDAYEPA